MVLRMKTHDSLGEMNSYRTPTDRSPVGQLLARLHDEIDFWSSAPDFTFHPARSSQVSTAPAPTPVALGVVNVILTVGSMALPMLGCE